MSLELCDITVRVFMRCLFNKDYTDVPNWEELYTKYIDTAGFTEEGQLGLFVAQHNLSVRLKHITDWLTLQQSVYGLTSKPHLKTLPDMAQYGHRVTWNPDEPEKYLAQLIKVEVKEKRNYAELKRVEKEIEDYEKTKDPKTVNARNNFVIMLNVLRKDGNPIDKDKTDMEELALMIKQHRDDAADAAKRQ